MTKALRLAQLQAGHFFRVRIYLQSAASMSHVDGLGPSRLVHPIAAGRSVGGVGGARVRRPSVAPVLPRQRAGAVAGATPAAELHLQAGDAVGAPLQHKDTAQ